MIVITSGDRYLDIDGYASLILYREYLKLKGIDVKAVSSAKINSSITKSIRDFSYKLDDYAVKDDDKFIVVDLNNKDYFDRIVNISNVIEIIDHHPGDVSYWKERLGDKANITKIGSCVTVIMEMICNDKLDGMLSLELLLMSMAAILDNTLNLKASITTDRDIFVYNKLKELSGVYNYDYIYFKECSDYIIKNLSSCIKLDTKIEKFNDVLPDCFSQIVIWDKDLIINNKDILYDTLCSFGNSFIVNLISLIDGKSYIICNDKDYRIKLEGLFKCSFRDDIMILDKLWLRKEIIMYTNMRGSNGEFIIN